MAQYQSHVTFSVVTGIVYALLGVFFLQVFPEHAMLASVIVVIAGILPNIDEGGSAPAQELGGLLAAISPLVLIEFFPGLRSGGVARIALIVICCYFLTRLIVVRALQKFTNHRGMIHSIPAAIITSELVYLLFWDLFWQDRLYLAGGAFVGYFSHLFLDASTNLDLVGKAMGNAGKKAPALKLKGPSFGSTVVMYTSMIVLGWFVVQDFYPHLHSYAAVKYRQIVRHF